MKTRRLVGLAVVAFAIIVVALVGVRGRRYVVAARFKSYAAQYALIVRASANGAALGPLPDRYAFKGGVVVIDSETGLLNETFHFRIPPALRADAPDQVKTVASMECHHRVLGHIGARSIEYTGCIVSFIDRDTQARIFNVAFDSAGPEDEDTSPESKFVTLLSRMSSMGFLDKDQWWYFAGQQQEMLFLSCEGLH